MKQEITLVEGVNNLLFRIIPSSTPSADYGTLFGIITDDFTGAPVAGVTVTVYGRNGQLQQDVSDTNGEYAIDNIWGGTRRVDFTNPLYESLTSSADIYGGKDTQLNVRIKPLHPAESYDSFGPATALAGYNVMLEQHLTLVSANPYVFNTNISGGFYPNLIDIRTVKPDVGPPQILLQGPTGRWLRFEYAPANWGQDIGFDTSGTWYAGPSLPTTVVRGVTKRAFGGWNDSNQMIFESGEIDTILSHFGGSNLGTGFTKDGAGNTIEYFIWQRPLVFKSPGSYKIVSSLAPWESGIATYIWKNATAGEITVS